MRPPDAVLTALRTGDAHHGLDLMRDTGMTSGALYPTLVRLERAGLVESRPAGPGRRIYLLTADGVTRLEPLPRAETRRARGTRWWLPALVVAAIESMAALSRPAGDRLADLGVYVDAVTGLRHGASLYDFVSAQDAPFTYPPFAGLVFWPLTFAPTPALRLGWTGATLATVVALSVLLARTADPPWRHRAPVIAAVLFESAPVSSDLRFGQVSVGLAALVALDLLALRGWRHHGALIGVAAAVKLTPLIFIPLLWFAGRRRAATVAAGTFAACGVLGWIALPADSRRFWGTELWHVDRLGHITSTGNQSLHGALLRLGVDGPAGSLLVLVVAGSAAAIALRRAARSGRRGDWLSAVTVVGAASTVLSPVSWTHHQLWTVLGAMLPVRGPARARLAWRVSVLGVMILPVAAAGGPGWGNARLLAAVAVACVVPLREPVAPAPTSSRRTCRGGRAGVASCAATTAGAPPPRTR
jgi:alpha-1,2-mannosyltransferase